MMPCGKAKKPRIQSKMRGFLLEQALFQWGMTSATSFVQEVRHGLVIRQKACRADRQPAGRAVCRIRPRGTIVPVITFGFAD